MSAKPRTRPKDLVLPVPLERRLGAKARGLPRPYFGFESRPVLLRYQRLAGGGKGTGFEPSPFSRHIQTATVGSNQGSDVVTITPPLRWSGSDGPPLKTLPIYRYLMLTRQLVAGPATSLIFCLSSRNLQSWSNGIAGSR